ncbi:hypothetical protein Mgra_00009328 [Meloidogyne graminicola]|uniref:Uncharacterized protein n=1 Tax=Meloidogyne graminicola TaxID=189291 RepID=A0A8S9Z844_9BILA|nr:hypothetical protein Mgra_00009328 [Meloidogyne graminicola]
MNWIRSTTTIKQMILLLYFSFFFTTLFNLRKISKWSKEYGPVYTVWLGEDPTVMVTDYEIMRDLFVKEGEVYAGRNFMSELFKTCTGKQNKGNFGSINHF